MSDVAFERPTVMPPEYLPDSVVIAEMSRSDLNCPTKILDDDGNLLTELEAYQQDEMYDDGYLCVGAQGVFVSGGEQWLSPDAQAYNRELIKTQRRGEEVDRNSQVVALVSRRPTEAQYQREVVRRKLQLVAGESLVWPAI